MAERSSVAGASLVDRVHAALRDRILDGELVGGARLRQEALADQLGVSRTPLREALRLLAADGLVELTPQRGAVVAGLGAGDMLAAWTARLVVEPGAARLAAVRPADPAEVEALRAAIGAQRRAGGDVRAAFAANRAFHVALARASGNAHLASIVTRLWVTRIGLAIYGRQAVSASQNLAYADEHERIADAVLAGDGAAAERLSRAHIHAAPPPAG